MPAGCVPTARLLYPIVSDERGVCPTNPLDAEPPPPLPWMQTPRAVKKLRNAVIGRLWLGYEVI